ncbi:MAG: GumC family protein [Candidatus Cryptobacteroides sp.]
MEEKFNSYNSEDESVIKLSDIWSLIWENKWWYVISVIICCVFAAFYLYRTPVQYSRAAKLIIDESDQDATLRNLGVITGSSMRMRGGNSVQNEIEAFSSPDLMQIVVERLNLQTSYVEKKFLKNVEKYRNSPVEMVLAGDNPEYGFSFTVANKGDNQVELSDFAYKDVKLKSTIKGNLGDTLVTPVGRMLIVATPFIEEFDNDIAVSWASSKSRAKAYCGKMNISLSGKESSVLVLSMNDTFTSRSEAVLSTLIDVYNEVWIANKNRAAINTTAFINDRLIGIEQDLAAVESALKQYKERNNLTDIKAVGQAYLNEASQYATRSFEVNNQLSIAQFIRDYLNNPANSLSLIPSNMGLSSSSVDSQISEYNQLVLKRDRLVAGSGDNNPIIADINNSLEAIRTAILRSIDNLVSTLKLQLSKIDAQEAIVLSRMSSSSGQELQLLSIERQQQITQNLYIFLLQKREENELSALINVGNTRVIMRPNGGSAPVSPNRKMIVLLALILGFGLPFGVFFLIKILDTRIKRKIDLGNLSVPFLAEIPMMEDNDKSILGKFGKSKHRDSRIIVEAGKRDMMNEAYRVLRTNVDLILGKQSKSHVVMFTSFNPNSGKTFTIMNMAASMALKNSRTVLVDLDLRKATLGAALEVNHSGVAAYLSGKIDDYHGHVTRIADNLDFIPVGSIPPNPTELLLSERFKALIESLRDEYEYIFLDCPPIDVVADASIITSSTDLTVFMLMANNENKQIVPLIEQLYQSGKYSHMALILNGVALKYRKYGYNRFGGYGYGYGNA